MKRKIPYHPFLFALFPVVHLYVVNSTDYPFEVIIKPLIILLAATTVLFVVLSRVARNSHKAAAIVSVFLTWFFSFGPLRELWTNLSIMPRQRYFLAIYGLSGLVILYRMVRLRSPFLKATAYLNLIGCVLLLLTLVNFAFIHQWNKVPHAEGGQVTSAEGGQVTSAEGGGRLPDIYLIVLDAHTSEKQMKEALDCDSSGFIRFLTSKGFYIAPDSHSNYAFTRLSMASSLNMDYLPVEADPASPGHFVLKRDVNLSRMIRNNKVVGFLRSKGYEYVELSVWGKDHTVIDFSIGLIRTTVLAIPYVENWMDSLFVKDFVLDSLKSLDRICREGPGKRSPVFVYAHIMLPHVPYMFEENGCRTPFFLVEKKAYCEQAKFAEFKMRGMLENLLARTGGNAVIVLQGDHGADEMTHDPVKDERLKMSNLSAFYMPGNRVKDMYSSITPVNIFRIIFNQYFGAHYPLLEDRSYYQRSEQGRMYLHQPAAARAGE